MKLSVYKLIVALCLCLLINSPSFAKKLSFDCSWDDRKPIKIVVDTESRTAKRSDGGRDYTVLKVSFAAIWLQVLQPNNKWALNTQMIERSSGFDDPSKAGRWVDSGFSITGNVDAISGGLCWERRE